MKAKLCLAASALSCGFLMACSSPSHNTKGLTDMLTYHYKDKIDTTKVSADEKPVADAINGEIPVNFRDITKLLIKKEQGEYQAELRAQLDAQAPTEEAATNKAGAANDSAAVDTNIAASKSKDESITAPIQTVVIKGRAFNGWTRLNSIAQSLGTNDYFALKSAYESKISDAKNPILYQRDAVSTFDITENRLMQCFSGTNLSLIMSRLTRAGSEYRAQNYVVIIKPGHVLPGEMVETKKGYDLVGVETTGSGPGLIDMGLATDLSGPMRIVDAEDYVIAELFGAQLSNKFIQDSLQKTAKKYGIPQSDLEKAIADYWNKKVQGDDGSQITRLAMTGNASSISGEKSPYNSSIFDFAPPEKISADAVARQPVGESEQDISRSLSELNYVPSNQGGSIAVSAYAPPQSPRTDSNLDFGDLSKKLTELEIDGVYDPNHSGAYLLCSGSSNFFEKDPNATTQCYSSQESLTSKSLKYQQPNNADAIRNIINENLQEAESEQGDNIGAYVLASLKFQYFAGSNDDSPTHVKCNFSATTSADLAAKNSSDIAKTANVWLTCGSPYSGVFYSGRLLWTVGCQGPTQQLQQRRKNLDKFFSALLKSQVITSGSTAPCEL